jgi:hypothetical protein
MRFELAGSLIRPDPMIITYGIESTGTSFDTLAHIALGFKYFEVICIGGGGGIGGGINTGIQIRSYGGAGGGGGFHRARGLLSALPASCPVVVGLGGAVGNEHASNPALTTDGGDGGFSTFNTNTCRASGGKGGKRVQVISSTVTTQAHGGDGGIGNRTAVGGGAVGGTAGTPTDTGPGTPGTNGADGSISSNGAIGKGGGGGAGGVGTYADLTLNAATAGGRGSYNPGDPSVYSPGEPAGPDETSGAQNIKPGGAGGAKASPLNGLPTSYGRSWGGPWLGRWPGENGVVIIRLTIE